QAERAAFVALEQGRVAEEDEAGRGPELEMAEPKLLVDQADRLVGGGALLRRDPDVGKREELQHLVLGAPDRAQLILGPAPLEAGDDLILAVALIGPAQSAEIGLQHVDRGAGFALEFVLVHVHEAVPGPLPFRESACPWGK